VRIVDRLSADGTTAVGAVVQAGERLFHLVEHVVDGIDRGFRRQDLFRPLRGARNA
jgi:hypothetical protein